MIWGTQMLLLDTKGINFQKKWDCTKRETSYMKQGKGQHLGPKICIFLLCSQVPKNLTCPNVVFIL